MTSSTRKPRTDAGRNRLRIVEVARAAFVADGLEVPVREIATRAGLGVATIYRHFPSRPDLIAAVLAERVSLCATGMKSALDEPEPWRALSAVMRHFSERQVQDRGLNDLLLGSHDAGIAFAAQRRAHAEDFALIVERARSAGVVRSDVSIEDVRVGLIAIASLRALPPDRANAAVQRLTDLLLAGLAQRES